MFSSVIFLSALIFSVATASPLEARSTCHPDFEGAILTVSNYGTIPAWSFKWSSNQPSVHPSLLILRLRGGTSSRTAITIPPPTLSNNLLFSVELDSGKLIMDNVDWSDSNVDQKWKVECASCATDIAHQTGVVASGCNISPASPSADGLCVGHTGFGSQLSLVACPSGGYGNFYFSVSD
ncbi:hypothetical protein ARMSODRAFT_976252 [Armillaria solidipes]|uniref:Ricin B lectin domain-containing protein n=1 Tax=Armillaria solidipes TaxID=1076256 RepID=A0A2H3BGB8_9AGAR|nr:hypothetical protein ARMSODRAFT_976252 [Armillaria solidipes]